jgi:hypothetical protein
MRTTVRIKDDLLQRAKQRAANEGRSLTSVIEEGLTLLLTRPKMNPRKRMKLPISKATGGVLPGVDLNRSGDLEEVMRMP